MIAPTLDFATRCPTPATALGLPWLVADIGGTNARFGWVRDPGTGVEQVLTLPVSDHAGPAEAARLLLEGAPVAQGACPPQLRGRAACGRRQRVARPDIQMPRSAESCLFLLFMFRMMCCFGF